MVRILLMFLILVASPLCALDELPDDWRPADSLRPVALFDRGGSWHQQPVYGQLIDDTGPRSTDQLIGFGAALMLDTSALGLGVNGFFDFYFTPWISASAHTGVAFGVLGRRHVDGGTGLGYHLALGAKFTFDLPDWEWSRWVRPWVAFYPVGFRYFSATESVDADNDRITYNDIYFHMQGGGGVDFYLTSLIGLGAGVLFYGDFGGSRRRIGDHRITTRGLWGLYFEYARLTVRF